MANKIVPKKSTQAGKIPTTADLVPGELAINFADRVLFGRHPGTSEIVPLGGGGGGGGGGGQPASHKSTHAVGGADALTPADIGAVANGGGASTISVMTEAAYTALPTKDTNTIYVLI